MNTGSTSKGNKATEAPLDPMFPQIVKDTDSPEQKLIGYIAYGLYEEARREWVADFHTREGRYPSDAEVSAYERSWTSSRLEGIRNAAVQVIAAYADNLSSQIEAALLRDTLKGRFGREVVRWLFSAALYSLIIVGLYVVLGR